MVLDPSRVDGHPRGDRLESSVANYLTVGDAAVILGLSPDGVRKAVSTGRLSIAATTPNGMRLFSPSEIQRFKRSREARRQR